MSEVSELANIVRSGLLGVTVKRIRNETLCLVVEGSPS